ncbi:MAG: dCTP deaminase domain-containing protein [Paraclostridium sp.]
MIKVNVNSINKNKDVIIEKSTEYSAGYDLTLTDVVDFEPQRITLVNFNFSLECEQKENFFFALVIRSSVARKGLILLNSIGIIDSDYENEIIAMFFNNNFCDISFDKGERLVQLIPVKLQDVELKSNEKNVYIMKKNKKRVGGFGSTGL